MKPTDLAYYLSKYFGNYLPNVVGASTKTLISYEKTFCLLFEFCTESKKIKVGKLEIQQITPLLIMDFLQHLEDLGNSVSTRNQRLSAIRSFFGYLQTIEPKYILCSQNILSVKFKRHQKSTINYLTEDELKLVLEMPQVNYKRQYRDLLLLTMLYDTAARVSELTNIQLKDIRFEYPYTVVLTGKGNKSRIVPLSPNTFKLLEIYTTKEKLNILSNRYLFLNHSNERFTSEGITYIVKKYTDLARLQKTSLPAVITPHSFRHSKAMHLLQNGVNLVYIRDFLGHASIKSTEIYAKSDSETKRKILESAYSNLYNANVPEELWTQDTKLFDWLKNMCK
ncbi:MAG TPA: integrase [Lachnospiraceae bacterium]|nr:integrase [Lachnospiraceae bacterium]